MPAYNAAKYISATLDSILKQTYPNIEIIVVNDGSTDETAQILHKYVNRGNIRILHTENRGQCAAANMAYRISKGEYIKFFDADDIMNPEHIQVQMDRIADRPGCIAACQVRRFYNEDIHSAIHEPLATWKDLKPVDWLVIDNGKGLGMMGVCMFLIPRHFLERSGLWNESLSLLNDYEFSPRFLLLAEEILFTPSAELFYRSGLAGSLSRSLGRTKLVSAFTALEATERLLLQHDQTEGTKAALSQMWHLWVHQFYIDEMDLYRKADQHLKQLGNYPDWYFERMASKTRKLLGWKNHKRITRLLDTVNKLVPRQPIWQKPSWS
jgi:glycosyltransferase involved in cell wall biosynthesis